MYLVVPLILASSPWHLIPRAVVARIFVRTCLAFLVSVVAGSFGASRGGVSIHWPLREPEPRWLLGSGGSDLRGRPLRDFESVVGRADARRTGDHPRLIQLLQCHAGCCCCRRVPSPE